MRQTRREGEVLRGCGSAILLGLRRLVSVMNFLVVRMSQIGISEVPLVEESSELPSVSARRFFFVERAVDEAVVVWMCLRREEAARWTWRVCSLARYWETRA